MLRISMSELSLLIVVVILITLAFRIVINRVSFIEAWVIRRAEEKAFGPGQVIERRIRSRFLGLLLILPVVVMQFVTIGTWVFLTDLPEMGFRNVFISGGFFFAEDMFYLPINPVLILCQAGAPFLLALALFLHFKPYAGRVLKYICVLSALAILLSYQDVFMSFHHWSDVDRIGDIGIDQTRWNIIWRLSFSPIMIAAFGALACIGLRPMKPVGTHTWRRSIVRRLYSIINATGSFAVFYSLIVASVPITRIPILPVAPIIFYALLRFFLVERMSDEPIIYFRSFQHPDIQKGFGSIVAPAASRFGVIVGLSHTSQGARDLYGETPIMQRARLEIASDKVWATWVIESLSRCSAVIVDLSKVTEGVMWELEKALEIVPKPRIAIVKKASTETALFDSVPIIEYTLGRKLKIDAQKAIKAWLRTVMR